MLYKSIGSLQCLVLLIVIGARISNWLQQDASPDSAMALHTIVMADHTWLTNYIPFHVGIGTCLNIAASSQLVPTRLRWPIFWFALIPARNLWAAPPIEMNFHLLALYGRQLLHPAASLTCHHGINPSPNTLSLNSTSGLRIRRRLAA
jgi:hypothetical protein